mgnify:CR=1 FL=1
MEGATAEDISNSTSSLKELSERRYKRFSEACAEVIDLGYYDQEDTQTIKGLRKDT